MRINMFLSLSLQASFNVGHSGSSSWIRNPAATDQPGQVAVQIATDGRTVDGFSPFSLFLEVFFEVGVVGN